MPLLPQLIVDVEKVSRSPESSLLAIGAVVLEPNGSLSRPFLITIERAKDDWDESTRTWWRKFPEVYYSLTQLGTPVSEHDAISKFYTYLTQLPSAQPWELVAGAMDIAVLNVALVAWARSSMRVSVGAKDTSQFTLPFLLPGNRGNGYCSIESTATRRVVVKDMLLRLGAMDLLNQLQNATLGFAQFHWFRMQPPSLPYSLTQGAHHHPLWDALFDAGQLLAYQTVLSRLAPSVPRASLIMYYNSDATPPPAPTST